MTAEARPRVSRGEKLIRGITSVQIDQGKATPDLFDQKKVSVNRLSITPLSEAIDIFKRELSDPDIGSSLRGYATFVTGDLIDFVSQCVANNKDLRKGNFSIWVEEDPQPGNPGHAEIMPRITMGISKKLVEELEKTGSIIVFSPA